MKSFLLVSVRHLILAVPLRSEVRDEKSTTMNQDHIFVAAAARLPSLPVSRALSLLTMTTPLSPTSATPLSATYEATQAFQQIRHYPDKIHWNAQVAFRQQAYRQLHHQQGRVGVIRVRLLEARDLQRPYWSPLALGPVKHFGFSKAHGPVSAFCKLALDVGEAETTKQQHDASSSSNLDRKPPATTNTSSKKEAAWVTSPVVASNNSPVWEHCVNEFVLTKSKLHSDGLRILLKLRVEEDATTVEHFLPSSDRLLGQGVLDVTELCLGETPSGQLLPGVVDVWVPICIPPRQQQEEQAAASMQHYSSSPFGGSTKDGGLASSSYYKNDPLALPATTTTHAAASAAASASSRYDKDSETLKQPPSSSSSSAITGMVRVLVSYQPHGLEPQPHDIVALEAFARRSTSKSSCRPLLSPLQPLTVLERRGAYLLCEYQLLDRRKACVRLHRNVVFVIERTNLVDAAHNLLLLPLDVVAATPVGQATRHIFGPVVAAGTELLMPALLSVKLVWVAARTTGLAGLSGVTAVTKTLWHVGTSSLLAGDNTNASAISRRGGEEQHHHSESHRGGQRGTYVSL